MEQRDQSQGSAPNSTQDHLHALTDEAGALLGEAKTQGTEHFEHYRDTAADQLDSLKEGARSAASALQGNDTLGVSHYLSEAAEHIGSFAERMRHESAEDLLRRGSRLAQDNPGLFLAGSVAIGFALSRFLRASANHAPAASASAAPTPEFGASAPYQSTPPSPDRASDVSTHKPYTPVDSVGMGGGTPVGGSPFERDPLKGGE
ncbi:hypothetical protein CCOS865_01265 [Pseudomonas reidholzensis]|uniref:Uncharacterized protein n=1 Tax=Pseudomonas reidholzensis TaxID=1785162 RepID=A0A383RQ56_9PSED|nr:hypothetical protein [Pseudomonas reidholzensis]SYX89025.1 hypothetical protein CCOS865_01265 [Pseudomonas reidholzensis]